MTMNEKNKPNNDDIELFRQATKGATPLRQKKIGVDALDKAGKTLKPKKAAENTSQQHISAQPNPDSLETYEVTAADILEFYRPGLQGKLMKKLRRGQVPVEDELDLHGYRVEDAHTETMAFLNHGLSNGFKCVRIIHGKGRGAKNDLPVLKNKVNVWLRHIPQVLAFCSAQPQDGGIGAVYVLLKKI